MTGRQEYDRNMTGRQDDIQRTLIERLDQGHLYPQGERQDKHVTVRARISDRRAAALPKRLSKQLIRLLFGTSTWPESGYTARPLHGSSSACAVHVGCTWNYLDVGRLARGRLYVQPDLYRANFYPNSTNGHADQSCRGHH
jgi:hypothetical protein